MVHWTTELHTYVGGYAKSKRTYIIILMTIKRTLLVCSLQWRHNGHDSVSNHQPHDCLLNRLFRRRSKKISKLRVTGLCEGIHRSPVNSPHKWPVTRKMFPFDDVTISYIVHGATQRTNALHMDHSGYGLKQWEALHCNVVSHWLIPHPECSLLRHISCWFSRKYYQNR